MPHAVANTTAFLHSAGVNPVSQTRASKLAQRSNNTSEFLLPFEQNMSTKSLKKTYKLNFVLVLTALFVLHLADLRVM